MTVDIWIKVAFGIVAVCSITNLVLIVVGIRQLWRQRKS